jgi:hypothetical protein
VLALHAPRTAEDGEPADEHDRRAIREHFERALERIRTA